MSLLNKIISKKYSLSKATEIARSREIIQTPFFTTEGTFGPKLFFERDLYILLKRMSKLKIIRDFVLIIVFDRTIKILKNYQIAIIAINQLKFLNISEFSRSR